jgi:hypothetical protein
MDHNDRQNEIVEGMTAGTIEPLLGYRMLRANYQCMDETERTTDVCRAEIALQDHDAITFGDHFLSA